MKFISEKILKVITATAEISNRLNNAESPDEMKVIAPITTKATMTSIANRMLHTSAADVMSVF